MKKLIKIFLEFLSRIIVNLFSLSKFTNYFLDKIIYSTLNRSINVKHNNLTISLQTPNSLCLWRSKTFSSKEPETLEWIDNFQNQSVFWDIGANIGLYTIYAAMKGHKTFSFEPSFLNLETLSKNINLNKLENKVTIFPIALNDTTKISNLNLSNVEWGGAHSTFDKNIRWDGQDMNINLKYKTLGFKFDDLFNIYDLKFPNYVKIDVDGIEHLILEGGKRTLNNTKSILIEVSKEFNVQHDKVSGILQELGFQLTKEINLEKSAFNQIWKKI